MASILVLRHAQSAWNAAGWWQGWADPPLSALGRAQARAAAPRLAGRVTLGQVVTSDLQRAEETARIIGDAVAPGVAVTVDSGWREHGVGAWSGLTRERIEQRWPGLLDRWDRGELDAPPGGERRIDFDARLLCALDRSARDATGRRCLVVSHGGVVRSLARQLHQPVDRIGNLAGVEIEPYGSGYRCLRLFDLLDRSLAG